MLFNIDSVPQYKPLFLNYTKMEGEFEVLEPSNLNPVFFDHQRTIIDLNTCLKFDSKSLKKGYHVFDLIFSNDNESFDKLNKNSLTFSKEMTYGQWMNMYPCSGLYLINLDNLLSLVFFKSKNKKVYSYKSNLKIWIPIEIYSRFKTKLILENKS